MCVLHAIAALGTTIHTLGVPFEIRSVFLVAVLLLR